MKNNMLPASICLRNIAIMFLACLLSSTVNAQNFTATLSGTPIDTTGWTSAIGTSYISGNSFVLTDPLTSQSGYIYYRTPVPLTYCASFNVSFEFQIIPPIGAQVADGIAFWYITNPPTGFGNGSSIGLPTNPNGMILIMDTYDNDGNGNDPLETLVGYDGTVPQYVEGSPTGVLAPVVPNQNFLDDGNWHSCVMTYNSGNINVYYDGSAVPSLTGFYPMNQIGYFGFSASTGAAYSTQSIRNVTISGFIPPPPPTLPYTVINYCQNDNAPQLTASGQNLNWYTTATGGTPLAAAPTPNTAVPGSTTWYVSQAYTPGGCESNRDSITVNVGAYPPNNYNSIDTVICSSELFQFNAAYGGDTSQWYQWQFSSDQGATWSSPPLTKDSTFDQIVFLPGNYWVKYFTYLDTPGNYSLCVQYSAVSKIRRNPDIKVSNTVTDATCFNKKDGTITINASAGQPPLTFYLQPSGTSNQTGSFTGLDTGSYWIHISDADNKCQDTVTNLVIQEPTPLSIRDSIIKVSPTCLKDANGSITVTAYGGTYPYIYELDPASLYTVDGAFTNLYANSYTLNVKDDHNCTVSEPIELTAEACCKVFVPTAFTPNNDGKNDYFRASSNAAIHSLDLHVYNRYGQEVYHSISTEDKGWDGTFNGEPAEVGTYFYVATYFCEDVNQEYTMKGNVTLIR